MRKLLLVFTVLCGFLIFGCSDSPSGSGNISVSFTGLTASGSPVTNKLILAFNQDINSLTEGDITLAAGSTGAQKGTLTDTAETGIYELSITGVTAAGQVTVTVSKSGYTITPSNRNVNIIFAGAGGDECNDCGDDPCTCPPGGECNVCGNDPCTCPSGGECNVCGNDPCTCPSSGECNVCGDDPCTCPSSGECNICGNDPCTCPSSGECNVCGDDPCTCPSSGECNVCGNDPCTCPSSGECNVCGNDPCTCPPVVECNICGNDPCTCPPVVECNICGNDPCTCPPVVECNICSNDPCTCDFINIGIGNPSVKLFMNGNPVSGESTQVSQGTGTYTVSIAPGTYTEITWHLNGNLVAQGSTRTSITLSKQSFGTFLVTVTAAPEGGVKNSGSHSFIVIEEEDNE
ncbi:MAG: Ig-like domain-containing protein [Treponema sp.]|nr:Ig-like domain-containing protein [Treponema sp.]